VKKMRYSAAKQKSRGEKVQYAVRLPPKVLAKQKNRPREPRASLSNEPAIFAAMGAISKRKVRMPEFNLPPSRDDEGNEE
jgi:hypothetical protein